jgi:hypothetical protein
VGALHAAEVLHATIWSSPIVSSEHRENGRTPIAPARLQRGLIVLAQTLHGATAQALGDLDAVRLAGGVDRLCDGITELAARLRQS